MSETFVDFKVVKERVSMEALLAHYRINLRRVNQHSLRGKCPLPMHSSDQSSESFIVEKVKNVWVCQSASCVAARAGRKGGNVLDLVAFMERCSVRDAALKLQTWFLGSSPTAPKVEEKKITSTEQVVSKIIDDGESGGVNKLLSFVLKDIDPAHPYLRTRGLKSETITHFGCGFFPGRGSMSGRVVIPIHNERGEHIAYAGRAIDQSEPKYKLPSEFRKADVLFNLHRVSTREQVIVVEGFFDCMKVHQAGAEEVVALMGSSLSEGQETRLAEFSRIILFLDGDDVGKEAARLMALRLATRTFVKVVELSDDEQPDQLSSERIKTTLGFG